MTIEKGYFYTNLTKSRKDDDNLKHCIEETVTKLLNSNTDLKKPGILLGKIQSGKTRAFLGVIALAFDNNYDIALILTKGTKALIEQTVKRLHEDFGQFEEDNKVQIHDIMLFPKNLVEYELNQKLIIVAKKEINNLKHVLNALTSTYPNLKNKRILIVDDEADFASISFRKEKETGLVEQGKISSKIDALRSEVKQSDFLQVTATPYSLYLQPDDEDGEDGLFLPKRPAFTVMLQEHKDYVGGNYYFIESEDESSPAAHVYKEVPPEELEALKAGKALKRADRRIFKIEDVITSPVVKVLRSSVMNFIVGGCLRWLQQKKLGQKQENYSFVIHTEQSRASHNWQENVVKRLYEELVKAAKSNQELFKNLVLEAYNMLKPSVELAELYLPEFQEVLKIVSESLIEGMLVIEKVNSDKEVKALLDNKGQLKLRTPLNIFIGGQILDRGITIKNLIGFYYGRNPKKFQQDTVLQHSRMYGARSKEDLAVTRFYTTRNIYHVMRRIHEFDDTLRKAFKNGSHTHGIYFIRKDSSGILTPCSPNKILLSNITTLKPWKRLLPVGFQTGYKTNIKKDIQEIDEEINKLNSSPESEHFTITIQQALELLSKIEKTLESKEIGYEWDVKAHKASLEYLSKNTSTEIEKNKVVVIVRRNSDISRQKSDGRFSDDPDGGSGESARKIAMRLAKNIPALILIRANGEEVLGWKGSPFWWPIIIVPQNTKTVIFAGETVNYN